MIVIGYGQYRVTDINMGKSDYINYVAPAILPSQHPISDGNKEHYKRIASPVQSMVKSEEKDQSQKVSAFTLS